jgi:REP element-mobilizing transposase RayT
MIEPAVQAAKRQTSGRTQTPSPAAPAAGKRVYPSSKVQAGTIFLTANTHKRIPLFGIRAICNLFFQELDFYRTKYGFRLYAYALLPDHFHLLLWFPPDKGFAAFLRDFKSAVGRFVIDWAKTNGSRLLNRLRLPTPPKRQRDAVYRVLQPNSYARAVTSRSMYDQKLDYIHANPLREGLVERAIDYPYSSLRNYELGEGRIAIDSPE